ncbi:MAG: response regulator [Cyclobacteriaceae bacterium]
MPLNKSLNVIAIDDDPMAIMWLEEVLSNTDVTCNVHSFTNSVKGADALKKQKPDVLFVDMEMPEMNGLDIMSLPLNLPNVIAMSSNVSYKNDALRLNAKAFLEKPVDLRLINNLLNQNIESTGL